MDSFKNPKKQCPWDCKHKAHDNSSFLMPFQFYNIYSIPIFIKVLTVCGEISLSSTNDDITIIGFQKIQVISKLVSNLLNHIDSFA